MCDLFSVLKTKTTDNFWISVFDSCIEGKFPSGIRYDPSNKIISYRNTSGAKQKIDHIHLKGMSDDSIFLVIMDIFHTKAGLFSPTESSLNIKQTQTSQQEKEWKKIKPKCVKDAMLLDFIIGMNLSPKESKNAFNSLRIGLQFKQILPSDIIFEGTTISKVGGTRKVDNRLEIIKKIGIVQKKEKPPPKSKFTQYIEKYARMSKIMYI